MTELTDIGVLYPPVMREMLITPQNVPSSYDSQGRYCAPPSQLDTYAVAENVKLLAQHQSVQKDEFYQLKLALIDKFELMEEKLKTHLSLLYYVKQFYPKIHDEWETGQRAAVRLTPETPAVSQVP